MRTRWIALAAPVAVIAVASGAFIAWPRGATPFTQQEALEDYRSRSTGTTAAEPSRSVTLPAPGVYTFTALGQEVVKLGVLPAETRPYPSTIAVAIVNSELTCFTMTLNLIDQHREDTTYCVEGEGRLRIAAHNKHQEVGALSPSASMTCDPGTLLVAGRKENHRVTCTLALSGGPAHLTATLFGVTTVSEHTTVTVSGSEVAAVAVEIAYQIAGDLTGTWREKVWFAEQSWLPMRIERNLDLRGLATFTEQSTLELTDITPQR